MSHSRILNVALVGLLLTAHAAGALGQDAPAPVSFTKDVAPIFLKHCAACHGPPEVNGGYQVTTYALLMKPGETELPAITAGSPDESEVFNLISMDDADLRMPKEADPLTAEQVGVIKRWIDEGAKFDGEDANAALASIVPTTTQPDPPQAYRRPVPTTALAFSPDGSEVAASGYHEVTIWNAADGQLARRIKNVAQRVYSVAYNADGSLLAVAGGVPGQLGEVKLFNPVDGTLVKEFPPAADVVYRAVFNPAGTKLATGGADRAIRIYDVASGNEEVLIEDHADWVVGLAWSPDGAKLASASRDKTSKLFNAANGESLVTYSGHGEAVFDVGFSGDAALAFSAGADKKVHAWNPEDAAKKGEYGGFGRDVLALATADDKILSCSADNTVRQHRVEGFKEFKKYEGLTDAAYAIAFHPASGRVAAGSFAGEIRIWNAEDGATITTFIAAPGYSAEVAAK